MSSYSEQRIRNLHAPSCGNRLHKECRVEDCDCACHDPEYWGVLMDDLDMDPMMWKD